MSGLTYDPKRATIEPGLFGPTSPEAAVLKQIQQKLQIMLGSAVVLDDGEWVTGYQIKTGALHAILHIMAEARYPVALPAGPSDAAAEEKA